MVELGRDLVGADPTGGEVGDDVAEAAGPQLVDDRDDLRQDAQPVGVLGQRGQPVAELGQRQAQQVDSPDRVVDSSSPSQPRSARSRS